MKKTLLTTVAAIALIAGGGIASAQKQEGPASKTEAPNRAPAAQQNAPAEKIAPPGPVAPQQKGAETKMPDAKPQTTGQAAPKTDAQMKPEQSPASRNAQTPAAPAAKSAADDKAGAKTEMKASGSADTKSGATAAQGQAGGSVALTTEQKTKIRTTVLATAPKVTNVNFSLNVGTVVPRSVRFVAVPPTLIEIHPAWRGYMYFVVGNDLVIIEPDSLRIVAVISV